MPLLLVALLAAGCSSDRSDDGLPVLGQVPAFSLTDQQGEPLTRESMAGRAWVASFFYTSCPGPCPLLMEKLAALRRRVAPRDLAIVSFSVDPDVDTVEKLRAYAREHGIETAASWWLATGPRPQVLELIRNGFLSAVEDRPDDADGAGAGSGPILHSTRLLLVDPRGRMRGVYASEDPDDIARLERDARTFTGKDVS